VTTFRTSAAAALVAFAVLVAAPLSAQVVTGAAGTITAPPSPLEHQRVNPPLRPGDVLIDDMIFDGARFGSMPGPAGANNPSYSARPWEFGIVPIAFDADVIPDQRTLFFEACGWWASAGVVCVERTNEPLYVKVQKSDTGCYSYVGMMQWPAQPLNLGTGCWGKGTIAHELGHAFGLIHEHQRSDRDTYVTINYEQVQDGEEHNFTRIVTSRLWTEYDFGSIMHYGKSAFAEVNGAETITPKPGYSPTNMGQRAAVSTNDTLTLTSIYNLPPAVYRTYAARPRQFQMSRDEALGAMGAINAYYIAPGGLQRSNGLSLNNKPDFLGLAAWFFDVYVNTRFAGYEVIESRYNVMANITQSEEWRFKHPGASTAAPFPIGNALPFDRGELLAVMERLDRYYSSPEGLQRPEGMSLNGQPDFLSVAAWIADVYMGRRLAGASVEASWQEVVRQIQATDEWKRKHPG
jgi:hypothetical protein